MLSRTTPSAIRVIRTSTVPRVRINAPRVRHSSTKPAVALPPSQNQSGSPLTAGLIGGLSGFAAVYAWYHLSGTSKVVEDARAVQKKIDAAKQATPSPSAAASFIRSVLESQLNAIPGAKAAFSKFDELADSHGDEFASIISETYNELWAVLEKGGDNTAQKVTDILTKRGKELKNLSVDAGEQILDEYPQVREKLGVAFQEVQGWADQYGPEAKKQAAEVYDEVKKILDAGVSVDGLARAKKLVDEKKEEVKKLGSKAAKESYEKGEKQVQEALKNYPEVKKVLEQYKDKITGGGVSVAAIPTIFKQISNLKGDGKDGAEKIKSFIDKTIEKGQKKGSNLLDSDLVADTVSMAEKYIRAFPGGEKFLEESPDFKKLATIVQKKGPEAEKLARETWDEIHKILEKKYKEAEEVAEGAKKDVKKEAKK